MYAKRWWAVPWTLAWSRTWRRLLTCVGHLLRAREVWVELVVGRVADREISGIGEVMH
jgi:hypothetical protein